MSILNLNEYTPNLQNLTRPTGDQLAQAKKVKTIGIVALILVVVGIVIPLIADIIAFFMAKWALSLSRQNLVPIEYERPALWAYRVSMVGMVLWVLFLIKLVL
jgi:hypothetical protein